MRTIHIITDDTALTRKTLRLLDLHGLEYTTTPATAPGAADEVAAHGYQTTPVAIITRTNVRRITWNGYRPDLVARFLVREHR